jgi:circadian clock protein KaiB
MNDAPLPENEHKAMEAAATARLEARYVLRLYVAGPTVQSTRAIVNTRKICEEHLQGRYDLEVVDICKHPIMARSEQIIAAPTLVRKQPLPVRRFVGDMSRTEKMLAGLGISLPGLQADDRHSAS